MADEESFIKRGNVALLAKQFAEGVRILEEGRSLFPENQVILFNLAYAKYGKKTRAFCGNPFIFFSFYFLLFLLLTNPQNDII